jgi:hypothetical protein
VLVSPFQKPSFLGQKQRRAATRLRSHCLAQLAEGKDHGPVPKRLFQKVVVKLKR